MALPWKAGAARHLRVLMCGKRKRSAYERLCGWDKDNLAGMCRDLKIDYPETATKSDLAMLILDKRPNIEV